MSFTPYEDRARRNTKGPLLAEQFPKFALQDNLSISFRKMANLLCTFLSPFLLLTSVSLALCAFLTTAFAFSALFLRVLVVYAELAAVLIHDQFAIQPASRNSQSMLKASSPTFDEREHRCAGSGNSGSLTPRIPETSGLGIYSGGGIGRDFEGVGGWRFPGPDDEDGLWESINSRLELPATIGERKRHHHRSLTSGSLSSTPLAARSPIRSRARTPNNTGAPGNASPEEYFFDRPPSRSTTTLDSANIGRALLRSKPSSISTFSLDSSSRSTQSRTSHT